MKLCHVKRREIAIRAVADLLDAADQRADEISRQPGNHRDDCGLPWDPLPRTLLDLTGLFCDHWNADEKIDASSVLLRLAAWAILASESLPLWQLSPTDEAQALLLAAQHRQRQS